MGRALEIEVKVIPSSLANPFVKRVHYSGKVVNNSTLHLGVFLDGALHGVMSFGAPTDKCKVLGLVEGTPWNGMLELNRMAFDDYLPRNSESRAISIAMKLIKRNAPHVKWILSFADGCQCGDGTIYRASNFIITQIKPNNTLRYDPQGGGLAFDYGLQPRARKGVPQLSEGSGIPASVYLLHRQALAQTPNRSRNPILGDRRSRSGHVQGQADHASRAACRRLRIGGFA